MGIIEEKRKKILREMEAGRGSAIIFPHPVSLEPPYLPFNLQARKASIFESIFNRISEDHPVGSNPAQARISRLNCIRIKPSREDKNSIDTAEQFLISLPSESPIAFEIIGSNRKVSYQVIVAENQCSQTVSHIRSHFPEADVSIDKDLVSGLSSRSVARAYRLIASPFFVLSSVADSSLDPLRSLFGLLSELDQGRAGILQVLFAPVANDWKDNMRRASRSPYDPAQSPFVDLPGLPKIVDKKTTKPLFAVSLRMLASDKALLVSMEQFLRQFDNAETGLTGIPGIYPIESIQARNSFVHGSLLNSAELSYFVHLPAPEILESMPAIEQAVKSYPVPEEYLSGGPVLGTNTYRGTKKSVCHSRHLPNQHVYESGKSGFGKSNLILTTVMQRINNGDGVCVFDPHGALIRHGILPRISKMRVEDVIYFNAGDFEHPMAVNPLAHNGTKIEKEHIRTDLLSFFEDLFGTSLGVNVQHTLNFIIITLLHYKDSTLSDMERLMIDKNWRQKVLEDIDDERIQSFWEHEFPLLEKRGVITTITNKLSPLILPGSTIGPMLASRENKVDFLDVMNKRKVLLCDLSHGDIGKRNSQLLGKLLVSKLQISAMMREGDGRSPDFYCYIDEFQHMICPSMADILSGARKYGLHLWLANQMIGDIPDYIMRHVFNASTLIFFATDSPSDQLFAEKTLSRRFKAEEFGRLRKGETYLKMVGSVFNMTTELAPEPPSVQYTNEIIALSRSRYTITKDSSRTETGKTDKTTRSAQPKESASVRSKAATDISVSERTFLECLFQNPTLSVTAIYRNQKLSAYMGDKLKRMLKEKRLVEEMTTHLGSGSRLAKFLILTSKGFDALSLNFDSGKGGPLHRYWQSVIRLYAENAGYDTLIEESISGSKESVDIGLRKDGNRLAVEISVTNRAEYELSNAIKCMAAGYSKLIFLFLDESKMKAFGELITVRFTEEDLSKISMGLLYDFCRFF
ncbi:MAG: hypothetical protein HZB31_04530 [Nitrospirae bacterium]|nr:hypothetical protein [Nitrospirota bacterium]